MYITIVESKDDIRKRILKLRRSMSEREVEEKSRKIKERLFELP